MNSHNYVQKDPCMVKILEKNHSRHLKSLQEIQESKKRMIDCSTPETLKLKLKKPKNYIDKFKAQEIYRENQNLLYRLITLTDKSRKHSKPQSDYSKSVPRSMNFQLRKQIQEKIDQENKGIAHRISSITPALKNNYLRKDLKNQMKVQNFQAKNDPDPKSPRKKPEPLSPLSKKPEILHSPSLYIKNPYTKSENEVKKKQWKIAELEKSPSGYYLMAIPIAVSPPNA